MTSNSIESDALGDLTGSNAAQLSLEKFYDLVTPESDNDLEESQLPNVEERQLPNVSTEKKKRTARKTEARKKRRRLREEGDERKDEFEIESMLLRDTLDVHKVWYAQQLIQKLIGDNVFIYEQERNSTYLNQLFIIEDTSMDPLSATDPAFQNLDTVWIYEPGTHLVFDKDTMDLVLIVKIESFEGMTVTTYLEVEHCLQVLMDYTTCVTRNTTNASQVVSYHDRVQKTTQAGNNNVKKPQASNDNVEKSQAGEDNVEKPHGIEHVTTKTRRRYGKMFGAGWHASMEKGKVVVAYAPKPDLESIKTYEQCIKELPKVAQLYRDRLLALFPAGAKMVDEFAVSHRIPSFSATTLDGEDGERPFANSLTITRDDFSNYQHQDFDKIQIAFGLWWTAKREKIDGKEKFSLDKDIDHDKVKGGQFLCSSYGIGIDFERCKGLVSIEWRGKFDFHGTVKSESPDNATRFGTSVQLTDKGTKAVDRYWGRGAAANLAVTPGERVTNALAKLTKKRK